MATLYMYGKDLSNVKRKTQKWGTEQNICISSSRITDGKEIRKNMSIIKK